VAKKNKATVVPVPMAKAMAERRDAFLRTSSHEVRQHVRRVRDWFAAADRATLLGRYDLGREVKALHDEIVKKKGAGSYGMRFITGLCELFGWNKGVVYGALTIVENFTLDQITALCDRPMANGRLVPYGHLLALAKVSAKKTRDSLLNKTIDQSLSRDELDDAIRQATTGQKKEETRGRPLNAPKDLRGLLRQQEVAASEFVQRATKVWAEQSNSFMGQVERLPEHQVTEEQVKILREHAANLRKLVDSANEQAAEAERAADYLQAKVTAAQEGNAASENTVGGGPAGRDVALSGNKAWVQNRLEKPAALSSGSRSGVQKARQTLGSEVVA
jgi:hypothetical protein